jgi:hypothetical protein
VLAFGGYPSQTFVNDIISDIESYGRPAVLIYGGDFDATGIDILRDFLKRTEGHWHETERVALNEDQISKYKLPPLPGKSWDPRAASFRAAYGKLVQVELDALPPDVLKQIYDDAVAAYWDEDAYTESREQEEKDRQQLLDPEEIKNMLAALTCLHHDADVLVNKIGTKKMTIPKLRKETTEIELSIDQAESVLEDHQEAFDG